MSESKKAVLAVLALMIPTFAVVVWFIPTQQDPGRYVVGDHTQAAIVWSLRVVLPLIPLATGVMWFRAATRKDLAPDFLRKTLGKPFERDGMCFAIAPTVRDGLAYLNVVFQNQYDSRAELRVVVSPQRRLLDFGNVPLPRLAVDVRCEGSALGVAQVPIGVPSTLQGKVTTFEIAAAVRYPASKGQLLRFRNGLRAGNANSDGMGQAMLTVNALAAGAIVYRRPATLTVLLPRGVGEEVPSSGKPSVDVLWQPGDAVNGVTEKLRLLLNLKQTREEEDREVFREVFGPDSEKRDGFEFRMRWKSRKR